MMDEDGLDDTQCTPHFQWYYNHTWNDAPPALTNLNVPGDNYFTIRQINTYNDTLDCVGASLTFKVTFKEMTPPEINTPELTDFCLEALNGATLTLSAELDEECANTVKWYTSYKQDFAFEFDPVNGPMYPANLFINRLDPDSYIGSNELTINLADYMPSTNIDTVLFFFAVSYENDECPSPLFTYFSVNLHQTPVLTPHITKTVYCQHDNVEMQASIANNPQNTDPNYTFVWTGVTSVDHVNPAPAPANLANEVEVSGPSKQPLSISYMPIDAYYERNYSQQIFTSEEVPAGDITKLAFHYGSDAPLENKSSNVEIYLTTTDKNTFSSKADFVTTDLELVYTGGLNATEGWNEFTFTHPYHYTGEKNLVLVVKDNSGTYKGSRRFTCSKTSDNKAMLIKTSGSLPDNPTTYGGTVYIFQYRSDVKFSVVPAGAYTTSDNHQYAYNQLDTTGHQCGDTIRSSVYVVDGNGCTSQPVNFVYVINDTLAPVVTPAARVTRVEGCNVNENNDVLFETLADFDQAGIEVKDDAVEIGDACGLPYVTFTHADTHLAGPCEDTIIRVYTFTDKCTHTATFTDTIISRDTQKPIFLDPVTNQSPYIRMIPERGMNCTFNAPEKPAFVHAILPVVSDNCTTMDSLWLMDHATFYWENSELFNQVLAPGTIDIFGPQVGNQLTVKVVVEDACGNADTAMILYFNRPDTLEIETPSITVDPANICLGETATLTFDPEKVTFDEDFALATPLTIVWNNLENEVEFSDTNAAVTTVTPAVGDKTYHFQVTVTDAYGCTATSEYAPLFVKDNPHVKIIKDVRNGAIEPYCPNYGDLTIVAVDAATETHIPNLRYTWTGESVNVNASIEDTSFIVIVPDYCDWHYTANVHVVDTIYGCVGDATITVWAADTAGPKYLGDVINETVPVEENCKMYVPDFIHYLNNANIVDNCYSFSEFYQSFRQDPEAGTEMTEDTPVTIYVTTPCQAAEYPIVNKFFARVPENKLHVSAAVVPAEDCEPADFTFTATPENGIGTITYTWTKANSTWTANGQVVTNTETVAAGAVSSTYTYTVKAVDAVHCEATASVNVTVYRTIVDIDTVTYPNTNCVAPWNGQLVVFHAPIGTHYELTQDNFYMERISEVPGWDTQVQENTLIFDYLQEGNYLLTVTTPNGCVSTFDVTIREAKPTITFNNEVTPHNPTYCTNDNGYITIVAEPGYTYEVYNANGVLVPSPYTGLTVGDYRIVKTSTVNRCQAETWIHIDESETTMEFTVSTSANTLCGDEVFNGKVAFTTTGWNYTVTDLTTTGEVIYVGTATTLDTLAEGDYKVDGIHIQSGCTHTETVTVANGRNNPVFTATTTPNNYCENEDGLVNGAITMTPATTYTYTVTNTDEDVIVTNLSALAAGNYNVYALNENNNCWHDTNVVVENDFYYPTANATSQENTSCNPEVLAYNGSISIAVSANVEGTTITNANNAFNNKIKPFEVNLVCDENEVDITTQFAASPATFSGLNSGIYNFTVTSKFFCTVEGEVEIDQHEMPALVMHATPNTMCEPTFEKPGNGTIVMDSVTTEFNHVYYRDTIFDYSFYFASTTPAEGFESVNGYYPGTQLQVNYWVPISYTMYYLADSLYYVQVYDRLTGCDVADTITVPMGRDNIVAEAQATPNKNCKAPYDGTVTATATAYKLNTEDYNLDAVLSFRLVGDDNDFATEYHLGTITAGTLNSTFTTTFTGIPDGTYTLLVQDTTTKCVYPFEGAVTVEKTESDIVITPTITPNHACQIEGETTTPWDGTLAAVASSELFANAQWVYKFYSVDSLGVVWHKEANATYGTTNSWNSLETGAYTVIALDNVSGCSQDSVFAVPTDNVCAPEVTFNVIGENNIPYHFCLNTNPAQICAVATTTNPDCPATEYSYKWHVDCHSLDFNGPCVEVATDEVHNCTYTVTVTSLATGCKTVESITVVIDPIHTINYLVNDMPFLASPRTVYNCVNEDVKIGIEQNSWVEAWWTNAHVTPLPQGNPEYDFIVAANSTTPNQMYSYCVNVVDDHGCPATGVINLISKPLPTVTVYDTACTEFSIDNETFVYEDGTPDADYNVHFEYQEVTPKAGSNGCDSITIHKITLLGEPTITGTLPSAFCAGTTVQSVLNLLTITNAIDTVVYINGQYAPKTAALTYSQCSTINMQVIAFSGSYSEYGDHVSCSTGENYSFVVNAAPVFTEDLVLEPYCADGEAQPVDVPGHNCNICNSNDPVQTGCSLKLYVLDTDEGNSVIEYLGVVNGDQFSFVPNAEYDGKLLALTLSNGCGSITTFDTLHVDATTIDIDDVTICEGLALDIDAILGKHYDNVTTYLLQPVAIGGSTTHDVEYQEIVYNGEPMIPEYNGYGLYFVVDNGICSEIVTDTATITVNPLPVLVLGDIDQDLCYAGAANAFEDALAQHLYASENNEGWLVPGANNTWVKYTTASALVEAIKNNTSYTDVYYYVKNDCGADTQYVGNFRILFPLAVQGGNVTVCPNATLADVTNQFTPSITLGNYSINEVGVYYTVGTGDQAVVLTDNDELADYGVTSGSAIAVNVTPVDVENCGAASAPVTVTFLTEEPVEPTFKPACSGNHLSAFIATQPDWNTTNAEHPMSLLDPDESYWQVYDATIHTVDPDEYVVDAEVAEEEGGIWVRYVWVTECGETVGSWFKQLIINDAPVITNLVNEIAICAGTTVEESDLNLAVVYNGNEDKYDTVYTLDGAQFNFPHQFTTPGEYELKVTIHGDQTCCGDAVEELTITVNAIPEPHAVGDTMVCLDGEAHLNVVTPAEGSEYAWYYGTTQIGTGTDLNVTFGVTDNPAEATITVGGNTITVTKQLTYEFTVVETVNNCSSVSMVNESIDPYKLDVVTVKVTDLPQFVFYDKDGNKTHHIDAAEGNAFTKYYWEIDKHCPNEDILVWVDFTIYHNDTLIANDHIGDYIFTQELASVTGGSVNYWTHSDSIHWSPGSWTPQNNLPDYKKVFRYNASIPSTNAANSATTNHFPNASMFSGNTNVYRDLYLYFLDDIDTVKKLFAPFTIAGEYKVVYRLRATDNNNYWTNPYYNHDLGTNDLFVGGSNPFLGNITLLACDSITITVENPFVPSNTPSENVAPELAPALSLDDVPAPDMEVWPNPAPAVTTTLKARVHNLDGNATVTLTTLTGKQVYAGEIYIDNDNYYFEFNVNSLSVGSYIMTVRTATDIITKKVIVTALAR